MDENMEQQEEQQEESQEQQEEQQDETKKTFSQEEVAAAAQKAVEDAKKQWKAEQDEAARLAKLNKEDREKEQIRLDREKLDNERAEFQRERLIGKTSDLLAERGLSRVFAERLCGKDAEETKANIDAFEKDFNAAVESAVSERMKGKPPKDNTPPDPGADDPFLAGFGM